MASRTPIQAPATNLVIEWRHLQVDDETCERCRDTGDALRRASAGLARALAPAGVTVTLSETFLAADSLAESNAVLVNGLPLHELVPGARAGSNACGSCSTLVGNPAECLTLEVDGAVHEAIPEDVLRRAAWSALGLAGDPSSRAAATVRLARGGAPGPVGAGRSCCTGDCCAPSPGGRNL